MSPIDRRRRKSHIPPPVKNEMRPESDSVALYHCIGPAETFETSSRAIFKLIQEAQRLHPDKKRMLYVDIEGHRNTKGGFDDDMLEFQKEFLIGFLLRFLTKLTGPLGQFATASQENNVPPSLIIHSGRNN